MPIRRNKKFALVIGVTCFGLLVPLATARGPHAQEREKMRVAISTVSFTFLVNLIARDAGIFKKHGLDVETILVAGPAQAAALAAGEIDYNSSFVPGLLLAAKGLPFTVVMATTKTPLFFIMSRPDISRANLAGKKLAVSRVGSQSHALTRSMIKQTGINPDAVTYIQTGSTSNSYSALNAWSVDAATLSIPFNVLLKQKGLTNSRPPATSECFRIPGCKCPRQRSTRTERR